VANYRLTPRARDGLVGILDHVEERFGPRTANQVLERLLHAFETLARHPGLGRPRADITSNASVRFHAVGPSLVAYRWQRSNGLEILLVERGSRDWPALVDDES
jgi:plasmid stabilization system protein ParE